MKRYDIAIIVPDFGYSEHEYRKAAKMYKNLLEKGFFPLVIVTSADRIIAKAVSYGLKKVLEKHFDCIPIKNQISLMRNLGVSLGDIVRERTSKNTRENAINSLAFIKKLGFEVEEVFLLGLWEGMLRRYLTFRKAAKDLELDITIRPVIVFGLFPVKLFAFRMLMIPGEFIRICKYHKLRHL